MVLNGMQRLFTSMVCLHNWIYHKIYNIIINWGIWRQYIILSDFFMEKNHCIKLSTSYDERTEHSSGH